MDELTTAPARPMDRNLMGNDAATLRNLCGTLNNPNITGAVVPDEEKMTQISAPMPLNLPASSPLAAAVKRGMEQADKVLRENTLTSPATAPLTPHQRQDLATAKATRVTQTPPTAPQPVTSHTPAKRILFTGHPGAGKKWLAEQIHAQVFEFSDPIYALAANAFGAVPDAKLLSGFVQEITAWGEGVITPSYPLTAARAMFCDQMHEAGVNGDALMGVPVSEFGTPGYWSKCLLARVARYEDTHKDIVAVTGIESPEQFKLLREKGFRPYHVACHNNTRAKRGATTNDFNRVAAMIEQDITNKLSREPSGAKLWCVWNDTENPTPSQRLLSLGEFLAAYQTS
jgi:hypothetical protein